MKLYRTSVKEDLNVAVVFQHLAENYVNKLDEMQKINKRILEFNNAVFHKQCEHYDKMLEDKGNVIRNKSHAPAFHTFGLRKAYRRRGGKRVGVTDHRWSWWRETAAVLDKSGEMEENELKETLNRAKLDALHLADKHRGTMAKSCDNYFTHLYDPLF